MTHDGRRPAHLRPSLVGLVVLGGTGGTALRAAIEGAFPPAPGAFPWATFAINVTGAFALGLLTELLPALIPRPELRRPVQLTLGTGLLGGYTTYSTFVVETVNLGAADAVGTALTYAVTSLVAGFLAAFVAIGATRRVLAQTLDGVR